MTDQRQVADLLRRAANAVSDSIKTLLETKHLYQRISIDFGVAKPVPRPMSNAQLLALVENAVRRTIDAAWYPIDPQQRGRRTAPEALGESNAAQWLRFTPPDLKLFCSNCDRIEAFNLVSAEEFFSRDERSSRFETKKGTCQVFVLSYLCQACKGVPDVFMIRRDGAQLANTGRAPIEHVETPAVIPKSVRRFYSGAIVAHQSGQTLAGLFLLRTLIEQWARSLVPPQDYADPTLNAYVATLPEDFRNRFKSMRALYGELSTDIHSAIGSPELFDQAQRDITEHFEARKLFKLP